MSIRPTSIDFREAIHIASYAIACQVLSPSALLSIINTIAWAEIGYWGIDSAYKSYKLSTEMISIFQDLNKLIYDAKDHKKFLELEPFLIAAHQEQVVIPETNALEFNGFALPREVFEKILENLTIDQLAQFSRTSKCWYSVAKTDSVWKHQLEKLFPKVVYLSKEKCGLSVEQQVKIVYKRTQWLLRKYIEQYNRNDIAVTILYNTDGNKYLLERLVGNRYVGRKRSIDPSSKQGQLLQNAQKLRDDFNKFQETEHFNDFIVKAKRALDNQNRPKDFPERIRKMQKRIDENIFSEILITWLTTDDDPTLGLYIFLSTINKLKTGEPFGCSSLLDNLLKLSPDPDTKYLYSIE